jgi:pimeloyl-ACP methyl ester carboxylesterase
MTAPHSHLLDGAPRIHYLEWNAAGARTIVMVHGNSANAWWWEPVAREIPPRIRVIAPDSRGHGDSEWVRPAAYGPHDYAKDLARVVAHVGASGDLPVVVGHSMGGLSVIAFVSEHRTSARGAVAIDIAVRSTRGRDRFLRRLRSLPIVHYPDLETAKARFRLMPNEGDIPPEIVAAIAEKSLARTDDGRWTLKFDRASFAGGDGIDAPAAIAKITMPTLLVRAERSRIMTAEATAEAAASNPVTRLVTIAAAHHHVLLERPAELARTIVDFADSLG